MRKNLYILSTGFKTAVVVSVDEPTARKQAQASHGTLANWEHANVLCRKIGVADAGIQPGVLVYRLSQKGE